MLRLMIKACLLIWVIMSVLIWGIKEVKWLDYCDGTLVSRTQVVNGIGQRYIDLQTGLTFRENLFAGQSPIAPNGRYQFNVTPDEVNNLQTVSVTHLRTNTTTDIDTISVFATLYWSADSEAILVWEFDNARDSRRLRRIDHRSRIVDFDYEFSRDISTPAITDNQQYIFASYALDSHPDEDGILFINTDTGIITRFDQPIGTDSVGDISSGVSYIWSPDTRWLIAQAENGFWVIDPQTGDTHPEFETIIEGFSPIWVHDNVWFTHVENYRPMVWKADLGTGEITSHWDNAQLYSVSHDEAWIFILDHNADDDFDFALHHFATETTYPVALDEHIYVIESEFSPNGRCLAIRTLQTARNSQITIIDLEQQSAMNPIDILDTALITDLFWVNR